jgi:hypothetical protein
LIASKEGFGHNKFNGYKYNGVGNANNFSQTLIESPSYFIDSLNYLKNNDTIVFNGYPSNIKSYNRCILIYLGSQPPIHDSTSTWNIIYRNERINPLDSTFSFWLTDDYLLNSGFKSGDSVHIAVYPGSRFFEQYYNSENKLIISSGIGPIPLRSVYLIPN